MNMNNEVMLHLEDALNQVRAIFIKAATRIEDIKPGDKIPATKLADELAKERGMTGPQLYPSLKFLFDGYPGVKIKRGAHGGIYRPLPGEDDKKPEVIDTPTVGDETLAVEPVKDVGSA
jgi:hypothetical protein